LQPLTVITGASGFIGGALVKRLAPHLRVAGLSRSHAPGVDEHGVEWRKADLFSLAQTRTALAGARYVVYLVHSMKPSAQLTQARFEDLDLLLADNVARAARDVGAEQILFLGGLVPEVSGLSRHLRSRLEVERALAAYGVPVTALRAALVVGPHASSLPILVRLVRRLPVMLTPQWTRTLTQPIALDDVLSLLEYCIGNRALYGQHYDIGGPEVLTYLEMMRQTAQVMGLKRVMVDVPFLTPRLSSAWVTMVSRTPAALVRPLVESLAHPMVASDEHRLVVPGQRLTPFREALEQVLARPAETALSKGHPPRKTPPRTVRSVQRLALPPNKDATWLSDEYRGWLPRFLRPFMRVERDVQRTLTFHFMGLGRPLLVLSYSEELSTADRALYYITGGVLARLQDPVRGRLEFRVMPGGSHALTAIHDFEPRLPWRLYTLTQARVHMFVMKAFGRHLRRLASREVVAR
jgi:uncharacterized protein YbjT (DUF2867 family)